MKRENETIKNIKMSRQARELRLNIKNKKQTENIKIIDCRGAQIER